MTKNQDKLNMGAREIMGDLKSELSKLSIDKSTTKRRKYETMRTKPVYVRAYVSRVGHDVAADKLGVTVSGLYGILNKDSASVTVEKLARAYEISFKKRQQQPTKQGVLMITRVPADDVEVVTRLLKAMECKSQVIDYE